MPTLKPYSGDPGYYIRAWTPDLGNITYKLNETGWKIVDDWEDLPANGAITWQQINVLKTAGVVYTEKNGVINPGDETFKPDPDQIDTGELTEAKAQSFIQAVLANCDLSPEQIANLYQILGIEPPTAEVKTRFRPAVKSVESSLESTISKDNTSFSETLTPPPSKGGFPTPPGYRRPSPDEIDIICLIAGSEDTEGRQSGSDEESAEIVITLVNSRASEEQSGASLIHSISFTGTHITEWSVRCSQELTWEVRSNLFDQIGTLLPLIVEGLNDSETAVADTPSDFDISFHHEEREVISM